MTAPDLDHIKALRTALAADRRRGQGMGSPAVPAMYLQAASVVEYDLPALIERAQKAERTSELLCEQRDKARAALATAREKALEECKAMILGGLFLHDEAPTRKFAHEVAAAIDRLATKKREG